MWEIGKHTFPRCFRFFNFSVDEELDDETLLSSLSLSDTELPDELSLPDDEESSELEIEESEDELELDDESDDPPPRFLDFFFGCGLTNLVVSRRCFGSRGPSGEAGEEIYPNLGGSKRETMEV